MIKMVIPGATLPPPLKKRGKVKVTAAVLSFGMLYNSQLMPDRKLNSEVNRQIEKKTLSTAISKPHGCTLGGKLSYVGCG